MVSVPKVIANVIIETAATPDVYDMKYCGERDGRVLAEGIVQDANRKNRNGRFYDSRELFPELFSQRQKELVKSGNMRAENGHPLTKDVVRQQQIDPNNTVAIFTEFWTEGDFVCAKFFGTFNDKGEEFDRELRAGIKPSWSLRALGEIVNTGRGAEVRGIKIITYDRVIFPSHDCAYTRGIVSEAGVVYNGKKYTVQEGSKLYLPENDPGMVVPVTEDSIINYVREESANIKLLKESLDFAYDDIALVNGGRTVRLTDRGGITLDVHLESYIHNEIQEACIDFENRMRGI